MKIANSVIDLIGNTPGQRIGWTISKAQRHLKMKRLYTELLLRWDLKYLIVKPSKKSRKKRKLDLNTTVSAADAPHIRRMLPYGR